MKRVSSILLIAALSLSVLAACGKTETTTNKTPSGSTEQQSDDVFTNDKLSEGEMITLSGKKLVLDPEKDITTTSDYGFMLSLSDGYEDNAIDSVNYMFAQFNMTGTYIPDKILEKLQALQMSEEPMEEIEKETTDLINKGFDLFSILRVNAKEPASAEDLKTVKSYYKHVEKLAEIGDDTFYFLYNDEIPASEWYTEEELALCKKLVAALPTVRDNIILFPPKPMEEEAEVRGNVGSFSTEDLNGNSVTESVFSDYDITMVNIWATWCGFCVEEMPELQELYDQLPENVNLISICTDGDEEGELAKKILETKNVKFPALIANEEMNKSFVEKFPSLPTTIFVDKNGNIVGNSIAGVPARNEEIVPAYLEAINSALKAVKE